MGRDFLNITVAFTFRTKWATMLRPVLRQGICLFIGTPSETENYVFFIYSRPKVALPAAASSMNGGRE